jgi:polysaccharide biosynthesis transport protein
MLKRNARGFGQGGSRAAALNAALRRGLVLTVVLCIVGAVAGAVVGQRMSTVHVAKATILVNPLDGNPFSTKGRGDDLDNLETEAQLIQSNDAATMVQKREGKATPIPDILAGLEVNVPPNTQILEIDYSSRASDVSLNRAQWFAEEYLAYRELRATTLVASQTKRLEDQIDARSKEQSALAKQLSNATPQSTQAGVLGVQLEAVSTQINQLRARSAELQSVSSSPGHIVTPATIPPAGLLGSWIAYSLAGLIGGLIIAVFIALIRSRADNRIRHVDDIATAGQVLLGEISTNDAVDAQMIFQGSGSAHHLPSAFRDLRVSLLTTEHRRPGVIVVTTARHDDEPPSSIAGLALATATANLRTVVVEAMASHLTPEDSGHADLGDVLSGRITADNALVHVRSHLDVLAGGDALSVDDLFMAPEMHALVDRLRDTADIVFIVTSNVHDARSKALIDVADSVILEVVQGVSSYRDVYQASNDYTLVADKLLGVVYVANAVPSRGRRAVPPPKPTDTPVRDAREQASSGETTSVDSELRSEREIAPADEVAPDHMIRANDIAPDDTIRPGDIAPIRPDDIPPDDTIRPGDIAPIRPDDIPPDDTIRPGDIAPIRPDDIPPDDTIRPGDIAPIRPDDIPPDDTMKPDDEIYDPPPWSNGTVRRIAAAEQTSPSVRDNDLAATRQAGR